MSKKNKQTIYASTTHHPTEFWLVWDADQSDKENLRKLYDEMLKAGASHKMIKEMFNMGSKDGRAQEQNDQAEYNEG